ncbi:MAG: glycosyltransferase family 4 protein [Pyrinomonadaceae bacterium]|nr:glycosyltransferase family 4 protein [Sphingobacteriaceae bacterium]
MRIILIGNYPPDKQESMIRFADLLDSGFRDANLQSEIWTPKAFFGSKSRSTFSGIGKWLAYIDKYIVFPLILIIRLSQKAFKSSEVKFHVCDHSNAPYLKYLPADRSSITCHDVIAIRGGLGYTDFHHPASTFGKILQKWILHHLEQSKSIAFVSHLTLNQFNEIATQKRTDKVRKVIPNSFNAEFSPMPVNEAKHIINLLGIDLSTPFLLHVGSALPRKNRKLLLDMLSNLNNSGDLTICFAGESLNEELIEYAKKLGLQNRVISIVKPEHSTLVALYSLCEAFIFPSLSEGFGWPVIEAQACGAPVIASNIEPMPEVSGGAALHADPTNPQAFANAFIALQNPEFRKELIAKGYQNGLRFEKNKMIEAYLDLFNSTNT